MIQNQLHIVNTMSTEFLVDQTVQMDVHSKIRKGTVSDAGSIKACTLLTPARLEPRDFEQLNFLISLS